MNSPNDHDFVISFVFKAKSAKDMGALATLCANTPDFKMHKVEILSPDKAVDVYIETPPQNLKERIGKALAVHRLDVDFALQKAKGRKKKLLICDMDSTLIGQECIDELADFAGVGPHVADITERAMRGDLDFEAALRERVALLQGLPLSTLQTCFDERIKLNKGALVLARTMKAHGATTVIVSGGFTFFTKRIAELSGFQYTQANVLLDDGKVLSGTVKMPILGRAAKLEALQDYAGDLGGPDMALAIGDGANDLAMIKAAGLGIAYHAKPVVAEAAHCAINHTDLTSALYFQGYKESEFAI